MRGSHSAAPMERSSKHPLRKHLERGEHIKGVEPAKGTGVAGDSSSHLPLPQHESHKSQGSPVHPQHSVPFCVPSTE